MDYETGKMLEGVHAKLDYLIGLLTPAKDDKDSKKKDDEE